MNIYCSIAVQCSYLLSAIRFANTFSVLFALLFPLSSSPAHFFFCASIIYFRFLFMDLLFSTLFVGLFFFCLFHINVTVYSAPLFTTINTR